MLLRIAMIFGLVAMMLSLLSMAVWRAVKPPREDVVLSEIDRLHHAFQSHREIHLAYPPCMAESDVDVRKRRFLSHLKKVYPSSAYGATPVDFDRLNELVAANYLTSGPAEPIGLDLLQLDPAESLVFWLGGFPTPISTGPAADRQPIAATRLFGFNKGTDSPFKRSLAQEGNDPLATRTSLRFEFQQERLVDNDGDGWWEYVPATPRSSVAVAPFVYFDSAAYVGSADRPETIFYPKNPLLAAVFGTAVPLAKSYDPAKRSQTQWWNSDTFQIVCGGHDGRFSSSATGARITVFPAGKVYAGPQHEGPAREYDEDELDNVTNLLRQQLGDARAEAQ